MIKFIFNAGYENNFEKYNNSTVTDFGVPYDYGSLMHYGETAFSYNGKRTIIPKKVIINDILKPLNPFFKK